jgi:ribosomal protein S18 acetylase RimI-like enzyme
MIKPIAKDDLINCLKIFHQGYETVAIEFDLTEENCPDRGRASLPYEKLLTEFEDSALMFGYFHNDKLIGFMGMKMCGNGICKLDDIIILPEFRQKGYGKELLIFCKHKAKELGANKISLGMIDDNKRLRKWYEDNGFTNMGYKKYDGAPFTVGYMECLILA